MHSLFVLQIALLILFASILVAQCPQPSFIDIEPPLSASPWRNEDIPLATSNDVVPAPNLPLILPGNNSEFITLPRFPFFNLANYTQRVSCPHLQSGLKLWHDPTIWPNAIVPGWSAGKNITLPTNTRVLLSSCSVSSTLVLGYITVPVNSTLIFSDANINIRISGMTVNGAVQIGSSTCRLRSKITLTLHGTRPFSTADVSYVPPDYVKGIAVTGTFDVHGALYTATWSRLASSARANSEWLFLQ